MKNYISQDNYLILKNFISLKRANEFAVNFQKHLNLTMSTGDNQVPKSQAFYNYLPALELLCEKTPEISEAIGEPVLPTYTYGRVYKNKATLLPHIDRGACEISVTLHLDSDANWPIFIETPQGKKVPVNLEKGDAMLYLGCTAKHWREEFDGNSYSQFFLHYVRSRGSNANLYFDRAR